MDSDWVGFKGTSSQNILRSERLSLSPQEMWQGDLTTYGYSCVSAVGDRLFTLANERDPQTGDATPYQLVAVNAADGAVAWRSDDLGTQFQVALCPTADTERVYTADGNRLTALSASDGAPVWSVDLGSAVSAPTVVGGVVYASTLGGTLTALDAGTGAELWAVGAPSSVRSPLVTRDVVVARTLSPLDGSVAAYDAATGTPLWTAAPELVRDMAAHGSVLYIAETGAVAAKSLTTGAELWRHATPDPEGGIAVAVDDNRVYVNSQETVNGSGIVEALDRATGTPLYGVTQSEGTASPYPPFGKWGGALINHYRAFDPETGSDLGAHSIFAGIPDDGASPPQAVSGHTIYGWQRVSGDSLVLVARDASPEAADPDGTERVSIAGAGDQGDNASLNASVSSDGRFVSFVSAASNLVWGDTNGSNDVFVHDRETGATERVSIDSAGDEANSDSQNPVVSANGRFVAFSSAASNLVPGDTNGTFDVFLHDRQTGTTERVSVDSAENQSNDIEFSIPDLAISGDGRYVAFRSYKADLVPGDTNGSPCCNADIFVRDRQAGTTERVSVDSAGIEANGDSAYSSISADGRYVAFTSSASNLVAGDTNVGYEAFVHDRQTGITERVSLDSAEAEGNSESVNTVISADGDFVAFTSYASNLVADDTNGKSDVFIRDRQTGTTERVSVDSAGNEMSNNSLLPAISGDGRFVAFESRTEGLDQFGDPTITTDIDVLVHDRQAGTTETASVDSSGNEANGFSTVPAISADGGFVAFQSSGSNLVPGDTNGVPDVFVHALGGSVSDPDADDDGIADTVDVNPGTQSDAFDDGAGTSGSITDRAGLSVTIEDSALPSPDDGVRVSVGPGSGEVGIDACGFQHLVAAGTETTITCASTILNVALGEVKVVLGGGLTVVSVSAGSAAEVSDNGDGSFTVENLGSGDVTITVDGVETTLGPGQTNDVSTWDFQGFSSPVDNPSTVNVASAGQGVPLKWRLVRADGTPVTNLAGAHLNASTRACSLGTTPDLLEEVASGPSGLQNLGNGYYQFNWKTPKSYAKSCKTAHLDLGEGITRDAYFDFKK
jgi:outer membrane protein assembly factor BamB